MVDPTKPPGPGEAADEGLNQPPKQQPEQSADNPSPSKADYELRKLRQEIVHERVKLVLAIIAVFGTLGGVGLDRWKLHEQRAYDAQQTRKRIKLERMTALVTEYDQLTGATITSASVATLRGIALRTTLEETRRRLAACQQGDAGPVPGLDDILQQTSDSPGGLRQWSEGAALQERWESRRHAIAPDFLPLFGPDLGGRWGDVVTAAWEALNAAYNINGSGQVTEKLETFRQTSNSFRDALYLKLREEEGRTRE